VGTEQSTRVYRRSHLRELARKANLIRDLDDLGDTLCAHGCIGVLRQTPKEQVAGEQRNLDHPLAVSIVPNQPVHRYIWIAAGPRNDLGSRLFLSAARVEDHPAKARRGLATKTKNQWVIGKEEDA
jgi:hypothetical protein